jgi:hypothetical protein
MDVLYYDTSYPSAYTNARQLSKAVGQKQSKVQKWLDSQDAYTLTKPARVRFQRRQTIVNAINDQWQMDLMDPLWT